MVVGAVSTGEIVVVGEISVGEIVVVVGETKVGERVVGVSIGLSSGALWIFAGARVCTGDNSLTAGASTNCGGVVKYLPEFDNV